MSGTRKNKATKQLQVVTINGQRIKRATLEQIAERIFPRTPEPEERVIRDLKAPADHVERATMLLLAIIDDLHKNMDHADWLGERIEVLAKTAVRHLDHAGVALGNTIAGNFEDEFAALGPAGREQEEVAHG